MPSKIVIVCGPTASGKTRLGVALAEALHGEVVSADSMQIYRGMDIGTAKPTAEERNGIPHHMVDVADPWENYSVARYVQEASACVEDILQRGKLPLLVGGTGLYLDALCRGNPFAAFRPESGHRERLQLRAQQEGASVLWRELETIDPEAAARLHPNDEKRIIRALEVYYETGKTISQHNRETQALPPRYQALTIGLNFQDRAHLHARINQRVDEMMAQGLHAEVQSLLESGISPHCTAMQAIGYKELAAAIAQGGDLSAAVEEVKLRSRQYAKRQMTWFRRDKTTHWILWEENPNFSNALQDSTDFLKGAGVG